MSSRTPDPRQGSTTTTTAATTGADGATRVAGRPTRTRWVVPLVAALAVLALGLTLSRCRGDDAPSGAATGPTSSAIAPASPPAPTTAAAAGPSEMSSSMSSSPSPTDSPSTAAPEAAGTAGTIVVADTVVLGPEGLRGLKGETGRKAVGRGVRVQSVPADEGFWVGPDAKDRVWVQLRQTGGESPYTVKKGDTVDFTGRVTAVPPGFTTRVGLTAAEGARQLEEQGHYISVKESALRLSS